jgi:hypothetical protein
MNLTKEQQLKTKILKYNQWLLNNKHIEGTTSYKIKERYRNYYVNQLIELQEYGIL